MNEFEARDYILDKYNDKLKDMDSINAMISEIIKDFNHDYGAAPRTIGAGLICIANYLCSAMGLTGFQTSCMMWDFIRGFNLRNNKCGAKLVNYDDMLYPQYDYKFQKTISEDVWKNLQEEAKKLLNDSDGYVISYAHSDVIHHWKSIVDGVVPFGYTVTEN